MGGEVILYYSQTRRMKPILPPPRNSRARRERAKDSVSKVNEAVKSWLPFEDEIVHSLSSDSFDQEFNERAQYDVAISTSESCDSDDYENPGRIEIELGANPNSSRHMEQFLSSWNWGDESRAASTSHLRNVIPVPPPSRSYSNNDSASVNSSSNSVSTDQVSNIGNKKIRKGLHKKRSASIPPRRDNTKTTGRGRSASQNRSTASPSVPRRGRSISISRKKLPGKPKSKQAEKVNKQDKVSKRSRSKSIVRLGFKSKASKDKKSAKSKEDEGVVVVDATVNGRNNTSMDRRANPLPMSPVLNITPTAPNPETPVEFLTPTNQPIPTETFHSIEEATVVLPSVIHTRELLETSVYNNEATGIWITTINMSQKERVNKANAGKYLKAFSFQTQNEAIESAYANAPPKMLPFDEYPFCFLCSAQFSVFKRASHCRNCGVCICNGCSVSWNKVNIPETYNIKGETSIKVCKSCDSVSNLFKTALLEGNYANAIKIYNTGNINLRCPLVTNKGLESMLPIHCAAEGGSLDLLEWLVEVHFCPLKRIRTSNRIKNQHADELITTSKGRSVLEIAMANQSVEILRYLVCDKGISVDGVKDLTVALKALEAVLRAPQCNAEDMIMSSSERANAMAPPTPELARISNGLPNFTISAPDSFSESDDESPKNDNEMYGDDSDDDQSVATTVRDQCIICYDNSIDCVITPCGHQICCLQCSKNMSSCPVCNVDCKFIRIFRP